MNYLYSNSIEFIISFRFLVTFIIFLISFSKFLDVFPAFKCASAIGNLRRICSWVNILIYFWSETLAMQANSEGGLLPFCCLSKSKIFSTISTTFFGFSFSRIYFLLISFLKSINLLLLLLTIFSFLFSLAPITKNDGFQYLKRAKNISLFISLLSATIPIINSCCRISCV